MTRRLFGTDGVRGVAGEFLTVELALALARAATRRAGSGPPPRVLVIRDTRESGEMLEAAVAAGVAAAGGEALLGGVLPTPGVPLLIGRYGFDLGVVLSASHNSYRDNGIKFFGGDGYKLSDAVELEIEAALERRNGAAPAVGRVRTLHGALEDYLRALHERFAHLDLAGRRPGHGLGAAATRPAGQPQARAARDARAQADPAPPAVGPPAAAGVLLRRAARPALASGHDQRVGRRARLGLPDGRDRLLQARDHRLASGDPLPRPRVDHADRARRARTARSRPAR